MPIAPDMLSQKPVGKKDDPRKKFIDYVEITDLKDLLDERCGLNYWETKFIKSEIVGQRYIVWIELIITCDDGSFSQIGNGEEQMSGAMFGDPASNAFAQAMRRAGSLHGLGRELWRKELSEQQRALLAVANAGLLDNTETQLVKDAVNVARIADHQPAQSQNGKPMTDAQKKLAAHQAAQAKAAAPSATPPATPAIATPPPAAVPATEQVAAESQQNATSANVSAETSNVLNMPPLASPVPASTQPTTIVEDWPRDENGELMAGPNTIEQLHIQAERINRSEDVICKFYSKDTIELFGDFINRRAVEILNELKRKPTSKAYEEKRRSQNAVNTAR